MIGIVGRQGFVGVQKSPKVSQFDLSVGKNTQNSYVIDEATCSFC